MENTTCEVEGCDKPKYQNKLMCGSHYMRWYRYGDPLAEKRPKREVCKIDGCDKITSALGWCAMHYTRYLRHGDPLVKLKPVPPRRAPKPKPEPKPRIKPEPRFCGIEGCGKLHSGRGWCKEHYDRYLYYGDPLGAWVPRTDLTYAGAHDRVRYRRGSPTDYRCQSCGDPAAEWAYDHCDPDERHEYLGAYRVAYSVKPENYMPLCVLCHRRFDKGLIEISGSLSATPRRASE